MGKLRGSQSHYDSNHDGRLSSREWDNWYWGTYGVDIELSERKRAQQVRAARLKRVQQVKSSWAVWLDRALEMMEFSYTTIHANAGKLLGYRASEDMANQTLIYWITHGLADGSAWNTTWNINAGAYVSDTAFYPAKSLVKEFLNRHPELGSYEAVENAVRSGSTLHKAVGALNSSDCGLFWKAMIDVLPPYREEAIQNFDVISSFTPYEEDADAEKAETLRELMKALFPIYSFFSGKTDDAADRESERLRMLFETFWAQLSAPDETAENDF